MARAQANRSVATQKVTAPGETATPQPRASRRSERSSLSRTSKADARPVASSSRKAPSQRASARQMPAPNIKSCNSSRSLGSGIACARTFAIASASSCVRSRSSTGSPRRIRTARVRRSSSGASSRNVKGLPFRISCPSGEGSVVSTQSSSHRPSRIRSIRSFSPSTSIAS